MKIAKIAIALLAAALIIAGTFLVSGKLAHPFTPNFVTDQITGNSNNSSDVRTIENASENSPFPISEDDLRNFSDVKGLPTLERADAETEAFVESLQSIRKVKDSLSYDIDLIWYPEYNYKKLYNDVTAELSALTKVYSGAGSVFQCRVSRRKVELFFVDNAWLVFHAIFRL